MLAYLLAIIVVVIAAALAFGLAALLHMQGLTYVLFVVILLLLGIAAAVTIVVLHLRNEKQKALGGDADDNGARSELDLLLNDANRKLRESQQGAKTLESLPVIYILGDPGSAKTTMILQSGLEPELLVGSASQTGEQAATQILNLWYTRFAAFLEIGPSIRQSNALLARLMHRTRATAYRSAFGAGAPPRAVLVCLSADQLLASQGTDSLLGSARVAGGQLREISRVFGMAVPVYVVVTKIDRIPHFEDYVRNLSEDEVRQVLGAPLGRIDSSAGTYADQASRTLTAAMDALVFKLGGFRIEMLHRENEAANVPGVYEFPREFGKLRKNLIQYLVELCKPSQLSANPYLRGFYFTGVRARVVERVSAARAALEAPVAKDAGATQFLDLSTLRARAAGQAAAPVVTASRIPQWTFLPRLLPEAILGDKSALASTRQSAPGRLFRRILFGTLTFAFAFATLLILVSYFNNDALERRIHDDAQALPAAETDAIVPPTPTQLKKLDDLRQVIVQLDGDEKNGKPLLYRFGLYQGDKLRESAWRIYFDRFRPLFLNQIQQGLVHYLKSLPNTSQANGGDVGAYQAAYNSLAAYLITTTNPDRSQPSFQTPILARYWNNGNQSDPDQLVQKQIDFYGDELLRRPPYTINPDDVVNHARAYLNTFLVTTRVYQSMLTDADKKNPYGINFDKQYPNPYVLDSFFIRGAFTREGFAFMHDDALLHPGRYAGGEKWVLGEQPTANAVNVDATVLTKQLTDMYTSEYNSKWHQFLNSAHLAPCKGLTEAPNELRALADSRSPILTLIWLVSHNTDVADEQIKGTFQPTQILVDPNASETLIGGKNTEYIGDLSNLALVLKGMFDQNPTGPFDPADFNKQVGPKILDAVGSVDQVGRSFARNSDIQGKVKDLMSAPIDCVDQSKPSAGAVASEAGDKICRAINPLLGKFPFSPSSSAQANLSEIDSVFMPDTGVLWTEYNSKLKPFLVQITAQLGAPYEQAPNPPERLNPHFITYFNRAARISNALYPPGQKNATFTFNLSLIPGGGVTNATFDVDGLRIPAGASSQQFTWNGATAQKASLVAEGQEVPFTGKWSVFQLVRAATRISRSATGYKLEYPINTATTIAGRTVEAGGSKVATFELSGPGADLLVGDGFSGLSCVKALAK